ncbi:MAG: STAS domain-containing protein [Alphaproteobacteria bacterium]|nr:STAS domain-containing protein [Alphaproteobacteria bacterium]MBU1525214.1 STAS domain-containing protein [Alphaproteobacteria bacterium]MBU2117757.1 STAS domain-containing protein [Alphaproteobacteria bacterium]MBU2352210.1 STAS domain-containing protein [Alphaproteobacteria bacterium]MBU2381220.1 STAS domain-containing protein [Alphaproteobacteria bacterium]
MTSFHALPERLEGAGLIDARAAVLALRGADLDLSGAEVTRLNGMGLELILSAFRTWREDGFRLRLVDPSPCLLETFVRLDLQATLQGEAA